MKKEYLTKQELENKLISTRKEYNKQNKIINNIFKISGTIMIIDAIILLPSSIFMQHINVGPFVTFLGIAVGTLVTTNYFEKKKNKIKKQYLSYKDQLEDVISMDFEKKRHELEKKYSNSSCINVTLKSIKDEKEILEQYKQELNEHLIYRINNELTKEIDARDYTLQKLKKVK